MSRPEDTLTRLEKLRIEAKKRIKSSRDHDFSQLSQLDILNLVSELETHQIELEMQNEEMQIAQDDLVIVRDLYAALYDFAPVGYLTVSGKDIILKANKTFSNMLQSSQSELTRQPFAGLVIDEDKNIYYRFLRILLKTKEKQRCSLRLIKPNKSIFWVSLESTLDQSPAVEQQQFQMIVIDINDQKENEIKQAQLQRELQQSHKMAAIGQFAGGIAHDFNNILAIITGYTDLAKLSAKKNIDSKLDNQLDQILEATQRAKSLIARMMSFSYQAKDDSTPLDLKLELEEIIRMLRPVMPSSITTHVSIEPDLPKVIIDKIKFVQLLMNLVINARDSMNEQGELSIELNWQKALNHECVNCHKQIMGDWIQLAITDTGMGIPAETLSRIFEPFYTNKKIGKGTGLGLAIVAGVVHSFGGHILVSTVLNQGTSFRLLFPPVIDTPQEPNRLIVKQNESLQGLGERILIIDDEPSLASCMGELLEEYGYKTDVYNSSSKALEYFSQNSEKFDLVLTDQTMPELTGIEVASKLRGLGADLPIILSSGNFDGINLELIKRLNVSLLAKPAPTRVIYQKIKELLNR